MTDATETKPVRQARRMAREPAEQLLAVEPGGGAEQTAAKSDKPRSKTAVVLEMLQRPDGASLGELVAATGWLPHTTRAALTGLRKKGYAVASEKIDDVRRYRIEGEVA